MKPESFKEFYIKKKSQDKLAFLRLLIKVLNGEFDPGSGRTLAACLTHASRAEKLENTSVFTGGSAADG